MQRPLFASLICLALLHTVVDTCAMIVEPLWGELQQGLALGTVWLFFVLTTQSIAPSASQMLFGYWRDRHPMRRALWAGPVIAAVCMSCIGFTDSVFVLSALLLVGGFAIGAFHPEAAVLAGRIIPGQRTRSLSIFMFGGALGLATGPLLSGAVVRAWGNEGLIWLLPGFAVCIVLLMAFGRPGWKTVPAEIPNHSRTLSEMFEGRGRLALHILIVCSLRLVPNMAMGKVIAFMLKSQGAGPFTVGAVQSTFLGAASLGMLLMAWKFRTGWERNFMVWCPILAAPLLLVLGLPACPRWLFIGLLVPTGMVLWGTTPVMVGYAHQKFPRAAGLASAITMGTAWGFAGLIQSGITSYYADQPAPQLALCVFVPFLLAAGIGAKFLPQLAEHAPVVAEPVPESA